MESNKMYDLKSENFVNKVPNLSDQKEGMQSLGELWSSLAKLTTHIDVANILCL